MSWLTGFEITLTSGNASNTALSFWGLGAAPAPASAGLKPAERVTRRKRKGKREGAVPIIQVATEEDKETP